LNRHASIAPALALLACGGLDNRPLHVGAISGTVAQCDPTQAVVGVVGGESTPVDASCAFRLDGVPEGHAQLFVVADPSNAAALDVVVQGAAVTEVGAIVAPHGSVLHLNAHAPSHQKVSGKVETPGLPLMPQSLDSMGGVRVGPFPAGCWDVAVSVAGLGEVMQTACFAAGQDDALDVTMPEPDGSAGREGCSVSGCVDGPQACLSDGNCQ
jgi:hypothetical protein